MTETQQLIEEARNRLSRVRQRLLDPTVTTLEEALPDLEEAVRSLRQGERLPWQSAVGKVEQSQAWASARQLRQELAQVGALARQANEFYSLRIRLLTKQDDSLRYDEHAGTSVCSPVALLREGLVFHG
jgi:hypothetical protein